MENVISEQDTKDFSEIRNGIIDQFLQFDGFENAFEVEVKDHKVKLWLIMRIREKADAFVFYYTQSRNTSSSGVRWTFVPDFGEYGKGSARKQRFNHFATNVRVTEQLAIGLNVPQSSIKLNQPHRWKGLIHSVPSLPEDWNDPGTQTGFIQKTIAFMKIVLPFVNQWYQSEGLPTIHVDFEKKVESKQELKETEAIIQGIEQQGELSKTEKDQLIKSRIGQTLFKRKLVQKECICKLCGITDERLLIASHIKPWSVCSNNERLDVHNGFLFCPNHDCLFDKGFITFDDNGSLILSNEVDETSKVFMNISETMKVSLTSEQKHYLEYHREKVFVGE